MFRNCSVYIRKSYHRGLNSQGILLLPARTIENVKLDKFSFLQRTISLYNRIANKRHLDDLSAIKKLCSLASKDAQVKLMDIVYIATTYLDKAKNNKVLQIYVKIPSLNENVVVILEKSVFKCEKGNMWRVLGVI